MCRIVNFERWKRTRQGRKATRRARFPQARETQHGPGLVSIGVISTELMRRLVDE